MFDTEKFIECIERNPAVWNKQLKEYADRNVRDECWLSIGQEIYHDWLPFDSKKKDVIVKELKTKWRHIRDSYKKHINYNRSATDSAKRKKYRYMDALAFLQKALDEGPKSSNVSVTSDGEELDEVENADVMNFCEVVDDAVEYLPAQTSKEKIRDLEETPTQQSREESQDPKETPSQSSQKRNSHPKHIPSEPSQERSQEPKTTKKSIYQSRLLEKLDRCSKAEEDPDRMFILSLLPDLKKLDEDEKLELKLMIMQYFRSVRQRKLHQVAGPTPTLLQPWVQVNFPIPGVSHPYGTIQVPSTAGQTTQPTQPTSPN